MININISRKHIIFLVLVLAVATAINYTIAQGGGTQSHPLSEITGLDANGDGVVDLANNSNYLGGQPPSYYEGGAGAEFEIVGVSLGTHCRDKCSTEGHSGCAFGYYYGGMPANVNYILDCLSTSVNYCTCYP